MLITIELFKKAWEHARRFLRDLPVWCVKGSTVSSTDMLSPEEIPHRARDDHYKLYYRRDLALMNRSAPQLNHFCNAYDFDLVLIDGNEYTGWAEFELVRKTCKPTYIALHDTSTLKTRKIERFLKKHTDEYGLFLRKFETATMRPACEIIGCKPETQFLPNSAGWAIYKRVSSA